MYIFTVLAIGAAVGALAHWLFERANEPITSIVVGAASALLGNQLWMSLASKAAPHTLGWATVFWSLLSAVIFTIVLDVAESDEPTNARR